MLLLDRPRTTLHIATRPSQMLVSRVDSSDGTSEQQSRKYGKWAHGHARPGSKGMLRSPRMALRAPRRRLPAAREADARGGREGKHGAVSLARATVVWGSSDCLTSLSWGQHVLLYCILRSGVS